MDYTIATLKNCDNELELTLNKSGNSYYVGLYKRSIKEFTHKDKLDFDNAYKLFNKLCECIVKNLYSYEEKKSMLK